MERRYNNYNHSNSPARPRDCCPGNRSDRIPFWHQSRSIHRVPSVVCCLLVALSIASSGEGFLMKGILRRSPRLRGLSPPALANKNPPSAKRQRKAKSTKTLPSAYLPRIDESEILSSQKARFVLGVDEAGRGPLAGPVVAAAAIVPENIEGITDSKKITKEDQRERLFEAITNSEDALWAVAVMDAPFIDRVNILQATLHGMAAAAAALVDYPKSRILTVGEERIPIVSDLSIEQKGSYVVTNLSKKRGTKDDYYALIDGNKVPPFMPCESHSIVKGDGKEYSIAAASILAKVSRDRLMRDYHCLWPHYGLEQHKGYPTAAHMEAVKTYGASAIHRRTFRPLKDMNLDADGKVIDTESE